MIKKKLPQMNIAGATERAVSIFTFKIDLLRYIMGYIHMI